MTRVPVAVVDEERCIGCTRCIDACPVDAIVGAQGRMHTVVESWCIGCQLCLPPCPVDCIEMRPGPEPAANQAALNRLRFEAHAARLLNRAAERQRELDLKKAAAAHRAAEP
jgi:Na+-translocating ferredoxin:NAD+ oxidoreductase subunit B